MFSLRLLRLAHLCCSWLLCLMLLPTPPARATVDEIISLPFVLPPFELVQRPRPDSVLTPLRWNLAELPEGRIPFVINPDFTAVASGALLPTVDQVRAAFRAAFETWEMVKTATVAFAIEEPDNPPQRSGLDGVNLLTISDNEALGPSTIGATFIFALDRTGRVDVGPFTATVDFVNEIIEVDTVINPSATFSTEGDANAIDLQSAVTHELGHVLGRDHTGLLHATMFRTAKRGDINRRALSQDDIAGISNIYPAGAVLQETFGGIRGTVRRGAEGLLGAHVVALDSHGIPLVSALSFPDGSYHIPGLPPGDYTLYAEPIDGPNRPSEFDLGFLFPFSPPFSTTLAGEPVSVHAGEVVTEVNLSVSGDGSLNLTDVQQVDPDNPSTFLAPARVGLVLAPGTRTQVQLVGRELDVERLEVSVSGTGVTAVGGRAAFGVATFEVAADAMPGPRTIFVEGNRQRAALSGGIVVAPPADDGRLRQITPGEEIAASIGAAGERDRFSFQGRAGQLASVSMPATAASRLDSVLELFAPGGRLLATHDDTGKDGSGLNALLRDVRLPSDGVYIVVGSGFSGSTGAYTLLLTLAEPAPVPDVDVPAAGGPDEGDEFSSPRGALSFGEMVDGRIAEPGAVEVWTFDAADSDRVTLRVSGRAPLTAVLELFDSARQRLAGDEAGGPAQVAQLDDVRLPSSGEFFVRISGAGGSQGEYTLSLEQVADRPDEPDALFAAAVQVNASTLRKGERFIASLTTTGAPAAAVDLYIAIVIPDGAVLYVVPEAAGRFTPVATPLERAATVRPGPTELLSLILPPIPLGQYTVVAAFVTADAAPSLTTIQAFGSVVFQVSGS